MLWNSTGGHENWRLGNGAPDVGCGGQVLVRSLNAVGIQTTSEFLRLWHTCADERPTSVGTVLQNRADAWVQALIAGHAALSALRPHLGDEQAVRAYVEQLTF